MELLTFSSASNEYLPAISIMMLILTLGVYSLIFADRRKLPPITKESALQLIKIFTSGKGAPEFLLTKMRDVGKVFRLSMPEMTHWVVVCDPALARKILLEEEEKPDIYKRFDGFTGRVSTMFSKKTHGDDWHITRKGASTSFSMKSISSLLPIMYEKIGEMKSMLQRLDKEGTVFSLSEITTHLAMDFISAGKQIALITVHQFLGSLIVSYAINFSLIISNVQCGLPHHAV